MTPGLLDPLSSRVSSDSHPVPLRLYQAPSASNLGAASSGFPAISCPLPGWAQWVLAPSAAGGENAVKLGSGLVFFPKPPAGLASQTMDSKETEALGSVRTMSSLTSTEGRIKASRGWL